MDIQQKIIRKMPSDMRLQCPSEDTPPSTRPPSVASSAASTSGTPHRSTSMDSLHTNSSISDKPCGEEFIPTRLIRPTPKVNVNAMQFVKTGPAMLHKSAKEQMKKVEIVKSLRKTSLQEEEEWQSKSPPDNLNSLDEGCSDWQTNLDKWKNSRRKRNEDVLERVIEVKKNEIDDEFSKTRRKSKTFSEMREQKTKRGRRYNLVVHDDDNNDLSDLGLGSAKNGQSLSDAPEEGEAKSDAGFCTGSDTGSDGVFPEDNISDTSSALGDKREIHDSLLESGSPSGTQKNSSIILNGHHVNGTIVTNESISTCSVTSDEYTYDKAIEDYKQFAENSVKKRTSSVTSLSSNASGSKDEHEKSGIGKKAEEKFSFYDGGVREPKVVRRERTATKVDIGKRRSMFELREIDQRESQKVDQRKSYDVSSSLRSKVASFENVNDSGNKTKTVPLRDTKFKEKLESFNKKEKLDSSLLTQRKTPERDQNFYQKLKNFTKLEANSSTDSLERKTSPERKYLRKPVESKISPTRNSSEKLYKKAPPPPTPLKERIASFENISPTGTASRRELSVSMENLHNRFPSGDELRVLQSSQSITNLFRRTPSTPYMVVEVDEEMEEKPCVKRTVSRDYDVKSSLLEKLESEKNSTKSSSENDDSVPPPLPDKTRPRTQSGGTPSRALPEVLSSKPSRTLPEPPTLRSSSASRNLPETSSPELASRSSSEYRRTLPETPKVERQTDTDIMSRILPEVSKQEPELIINWLPESPSSEFYQETPPIVPKAAPPPVPPPRVPTIEDPYPSMSSFATNEDSKEPAFGDEDIDEVIDEEESFENSFENSFTLDGVSCAENGYENSTPAVLENVRTTIESSTKTTEESLSLLNQTSNEVSHPKAGRSPSPPLPPKNQNFAVFEVLDATWTENNYSSSAAPPSVPPPPPPPEEEEEEELDEPPARGVGGLSVSNASSTPLENKAQRVKTANFVPSIKQDLRKLRSDFLGTNPQREEELTIQPPPDLSELLRQERDAERLIVQKQASLKRDSAMLDFDYSASGVPLSGRSKYTWEDRMRADGPKTERNSHDDSIDSLEFHTFSVSAHVNNTISNSEQENVLSDSTFHDETPVVEGVPKNQVFQEDDILSQFDLNSFSGDSHGNFCDSSVQENSSNQGFQRETASYVPFPKYINADAQEMSSAVQLNEENQTKCTAQVLENDSSMLEYPNETLSYTSPKEFSLLTTQPNDALQKEMKIHSPQKDMASCAPQTEMISNASQREMTSCVYLDENVSYSSPFPEGIASCTSQKEMTYLTPDKITSDSSTQKLLCHSSQQEPENFTSYFQKEIANPISQKGKTCHSAPKTTYPSKKEMTKPPIPKKTIKSFQKEQTSHASDRGVNRNSSKATSHTPPNLETNNTFPSKNSNEYQKKVSHTSKEMVSRTSQNETKRTLQKQVTSNNTSKNEISSYTSLKEIPRFHSQKEMTSRTFPNKVQMSLKPPKGMANQTSQKMLTNHTSQKEIISHTSPKMPKQTSQKEISSISKKEKTNMYQKEITSRRSQKEITSCTTKKYTSQKVKVDSVIQENLSSCEPQDLTSHVPQENLVGPVCVEEKCQEIGGITSLDILDNNTSPEFRNAINSMTTISQKFDSFGTTVNILNHEDNITKETASYSDVVKKNSVSAVIEQRNTTRKTSLSKRTQNELIVERSNNKIGSKNANRSSTSNLSKTKSNSASNLSTRENATFKNEVKKTFRGSAQDLPLVTKTFRGSVQDLPLVTKTFRRGRVQDLPLVTVDKATIKSRTFRVSKKVKITSSQNLRESESLYGSVSSLNIEDKQPKNTLQYILLQSTSVKNPHITVLKSKKTNLNRSHSRSESTLLTLPDVPTALPINLRTTNPLHSKSYKDIFRVAELPADSPDLLPDVPLTRPLILGSTDTKPALPNTVSALLDTISVLLDNASPSTKILSSDRSETTSIPLSNYSSSQFPTDFTLHASEGDQDTSRSLKASLKHTDDSIANLKKLAELEQEMEKHDRNMLQRLKAPPPKSQEEYDEEITQESSQYQDMKPHETVQESVLYNEFNTINRNTQNFQNSQLSEKSSTVKDFYNTSNYKNEANSPVCKNEANSPVCKNEANSPVYKNEVNDSIYKSDANVSTYKNETVNSTFISRFKSSQENLYSEQSSSVSRDIKRVVERDPLPKSLPEVPPPVPRKQSILALSAIPKPKLTDSDSWIMKKKSEGTKKDYSKHWLIQEAEQRRLEQQERITRPMQIPLNKPLNTALQTTPGYQNHFQNIKSSFHSNTFNQSSSSISNTTNKASPLSNSPNNTLYNIPPESSNKCIYNGNVPDSSCTTPSSCPAPNNNWMKQTKTYQPPQPSPPAASNNKPLPDAIISSITQRVNSKINGRTPVYSSTNNIRNEDSYHDYMNTGPFNTSYSSSSNSTSNTSPVSASPNTQGSHFPAHIPSPGSHQGSLNEEQRLLSVSGKKKCSHCGEELGRGAAMIIESLRLFYHIPCFKCCVCGIQLGNGMAGADVRVRNHKLHCHNCYSNDEGMKFSKV